jgi:hypothetical protein
MTLAKATAKNDPRLPESTRTLCCQTLTTWLSCISCINDVFSRMHGYSADSYYYYYK